ncbi:DsbA family protein [Pseudonocardia sp. TRM90224]|uniref:DsbA family protein n=1 Tax=Pseudonocardia sp. TRM90224 TaxID=2812678 RepID=UPI001E61FE04|nr:thioredoxin domain-containing protein [Pseudonocardia sp. TRM90224]
MGGATRNEKKRRQEAAERRLAAAGIKPGKTKAAKDRVPMIMVAVVVVIAVLVGGGIWLSQLGASTGAVTTKAASASGPVVTVGDGPVVIDVYEDFLCPQCERFEQRYGAQLTTALDKGQITVRYHAIAILDNLTSPAGYSTRAANAALCSVPAGIFPAFHKKLFDNQPSERSAGLTDDQLIAFGTELKAPADFATCVRGGTHSASVKTETDAAAGTPALTTNGTFGTPTVAVKGAKIDLNDTNWLTTAIGG